MQCRLENIHDEEEEEEDDPTDNDLEANTDRELHGNHAHRHGGAAWNNDE